jgi:hypothetical protein
MARNVLAPHWPSRGYYIKDLRRPRRLDQAPPLLKRHCLGGLASAEKAWICRARVPGENLAWVYLGAQQGKKIKNHRVLFWQ